MPGNKNLDVKSLEISILVKNDVDFICLTGRKAGFKKGSGMIGKWTTNKNTFQYPGIWEKINNPDFNCPKLGILEQKNKVYGKK